MNDAQKYEMEKTATVIAGGILGVLVILNLILDIFGRVYL